LVASSLHAFLVCAFIGLLNRIDEFEWNEDPYAVLSYAVDEMRDDIHTQHAKEVLQKRAFVGALQLNIDHCTCLTCTSQQHCYWAFDPYNTDGDCIMTK
jgi:hypothetical protein